MIVVDSSGWIEFFQGGPLAERYAEHLGRIAEVVTPVVVLYEVYRAIKKAKSEDDALIAAAQIQRTEIVPLSASLALLAADLGLEHGLAMADSLVYATAISTGAKLVTSDSDFRSLPRVIYLPKSPRPRRR